MSRQWIALIQIVVFFGLIYLVDMLVKFLGDNKASRRYYVLHTIVNTFVTLATLSDFLITLKDPLNSLEGTHDTSAMATVIALHIFHMATGEKLTIDDWWHHILSAMIVGFLGLLYFEGPLINYILFFQCGLPGGLDYFMLALTRYGYMNKLLEKRINVYLNMWIRLPGILLSAFIAYMILLYKDVEYNPIISILTNLIDIVNCVYFATLVVKNYQTHYIMLQQANKMKKISSQTQLALDEMKDKEKKKRTK